MNTELFTGKAEAYAAARPSYPAATVQYVLGLAPPRAIFADIGAGTGKFTELLARHGASQGAEIFAVEPNADMVAQLAVTCASLPNVNIVAAPAEATTLPDSSVDVIIAAQAMHWFDPDAFLAECRRIGKPGAVLVAVYNVTPGGTSPGYSKSSDEIFFKNPTLREFPNPIFYTREKWLAYMTSHSNDPLPSDPEYDAHIAEVNEQFEREAVDGLLCREVVTKIYHEKI
ncbi:MAG: class I SAM-dependent methyltransferase [Defluviitaleaceae bacterium]|nr:class I SAM-dependent methyltransferase [Defluviitaleaceae bacterium]